MLKSVEIIEGLNDEAKKSRLYHFSDVTIGGFEEVLMPKECSREGNWVAALSQQARQKTG